MTNFLKTSSGLLEQMANPTSTHLLHDNSYDYFLVFSLPWGRKRRKSYASIASSQLTRGLGMGVWLAGSSPGFRLCKCAGGVGEQGTTLTHDKLLTRPTINALGISLPNLVLTMSNS
jgi:hypothetical protein